MERRKKLATAGAISLTASAAVIALGSSIGLFGLTDESPRVGKLSPIDSTQTTTPAEVQTVIVDDTVPSTVPGTTPSTAPSGRHNGDDDGTATTSTTTGTRPEVGDDHGGDDNRGPGSSHSGGDDDNSGPGSSHSGGSDDD